MTTEAHGARGTTTGVNRYTYRLEWAPERDQYVGVCVELRSLSHYAPTMCEALAGVEAEVDRYVEDMQSHGETPPPPLAERNYSGTFVVRTSSVLHARLAREAAEQGVSMNQWVVQKLAERPLGGFGPFGLD